VAEAVSEHGVAAAEEIEARGTDNQRSASVAPTSR
jgi:hypothetical protein